MQDKPHFQVTSPVLQRLQDVLRHLMAQGEGWGGTAVGWAASYRGTTGSRDVLGTGLGQGGTRLALGGTGMTSSTE